MTMTVGTSFAERAQRVSAVAAVHADDVDAKGRFPREAVDAMIEAGAAHGGTADVNPVQDHGFMYGHAFRDLDGHVWEVFWMNPAAAQGQ